MEGKWLKMPTGETGKHFVRKGDEIPDEQFQDYVRHWEEMITKKEGAVFHLLTEKSVELSLEQKEVIAHACRAVAEVVARYSGEEKIVEPSLVYPVNNEFFREVFGHVNGYEDVDGQGIYLNQCVAVGVSPYTPPSAVSAVSFHELCHLFSFQRSAVLKDGNGDVGIRMERDGMTVFRNFFTVDEKRFGFFTTEAIVEKLTRKFNIRNRNNPLFAKDLEVLKEKFPYAEKYAVLKTKEIGEGRVEYGSTIAYSKEIDDFDESLREIYRENQDRFSSEDEVFDVFAKALFTGRMLEVARLVEKTYGKGSFRGGAEASQYEPYKKEESE